MKQTRYNYKGRPVGPRLAQEMRMQGLKVVPTSRQRKFVCVLQTKLTEAGLELYDEHHPKPVSRQGYSELIDWYIQRCRENGIHLQFNERQAAGQPNQMNDPDDPFD